MSASSFAQSTDMLLGQEFLTWLWYRSEARPDAFADNSGNAFEVYMEHRVVVQGGEGDKLETASVSGTLSPLREARFGLATGKKVTRATVRLEQDGMGSRLSLKAEDFAVGLKGPKLERAEPDDDPDALLLERLFLIDNCMALFDSLYASFLRLRLSPQWKDEAQDVRRWLEQPE